MKKIVFYIVIVSAFYTLNCFAQTYGWTDISANMPAQGGFNDVHFIGDEGWITGGNDQVFYTPDGGETFQIQTLPANSGITSSIFMKNNQVGYVVTYSGEINKTDNGGTTWTTLHEPGGGLNSVHFPPSSNIGYTCGINGTVWMFDDTSITDISPPNNASNLQSICCPVDNTDVKVCGQTTIARHKNNTWANLQFYDSTIFYNSIFFINNTTGWCVGIDGTIIIVVDGISWVGQTSNTTKTLNDVFFINSLEGWAAGSETLMHTIDGGVTWTHELASQAVGKELRAIYFTSANNGYIVGNYTVLKYGLITSVEKEEELPTEFSLSQNYPNPFNPSTKIKYTLSFVKQNAVSLQNNERFVESLYNVTLKVYDILGREVAMLVNKQQPSGTYEVEFNPVSSNQNPVSGVYFYRIKAGKYIETKKMLLLR